MEARSQCGGQIPIVKQWINTPRKPSLSSTVGWEMGLEPGEGSSIRGIVSHWVEAVPSGLTFEPSEVAPRAPFPSIA